jgi:hypothetical protein
MKPSSIVLPWENDWLRPIFGEVNPSPSLSMQAEWNAALCNPTTDVIPGVAPLPTFKPVFTLSKCIKNKADLTFLEQRSVQSNRAIAKMRCFLELSLEDSGVGRQLANEDTEEKQNQILAAVLGTRSPATIVKRMNALLHYNRWHLVNLAGCCLPLDEQSVWLYLRFLHTIRAAPTKAMSFMQAIRFAYYVLLLDGASDCMNSRRLIGSAELQMARKEPARQARPLTVKEVQKLHEVTCDAKVGLQQRMLASHLLMMLYTRSRTSDLAHVHEVAHDSTRSEASTLLAGYIHISTRYHKSARSIENKNLLLLIVASTVGIGSDDWISTWIRLRRKAGLPVAGKIDGALQPAPDLKKEGEWMSRPLSCSETTLLLRSMFGSSDKDLTSHAMKVTGLSWCAKAEMPRDQRRLLGRHASAIKDTDSV